MKKLLTRIIGATLGLAMAIGVSVSVASNKNAIKLDAAADGTYSLEINYTDFTTTSYASNNGSHSKNASKISGNGDSTMSVSYTSYQAYQNSSKIQFQKKAGYIYNTTSLGTINSVSFSNDKTSGLQYYIGSTENPSSSGTGGFFKVYADSTNSTQTCTTITVTYSITGGGGPTALANPNPQYNDSNKTVSWTTDAHATKYQVKVDAGSYDDINTETYDASGLSVGEQHTVYIKAVGDGENYSSTEGSVQFTPTAPFVGKTYALCTSVNELEVGASYILTNGTTGDVKTMATTSNAANRPATDVTVVDSKITSTSTTLTITLGGSSGAWTFETENYLGSDGYFSPSSGDNNQLRVVASEDTCTISFSANAAVITFSSNPNNRNIVRYNGLFSCYASGQQPVYLWKEYKGLLTSLNVTGTPTKTSYYNTESFNPSGLSCQAVYDSGSYTRPLSLDCITWPNLTAGMESIQGSFTEFGVTKTTPSYSITVSQDALSTISLSGTMVNHYYMDESWDKGTIAATAVYLSGQEIVVTNQATFAYYSDSEMTQEVATPAALGAGADQTVYVKATYSATSNSVGYAQTVTVEIEHGSIQSDPLTAAEAITLGSALAHNAQTTKQYYICGIVSQIDENELNDNEKNYATFWLQEDNPEKDFQVWRITPDNGCANYGDLQVGAEVLIRCQIKRYNDIIETGTSKTLLNITYEQQILQGVTLNKATLALGVGESDDLTASPDPIGAELGAVTWDTSNNLVATVTQDGHVVGVGAGSTNITATAGGFTATCVVTVSLKATLSYGGNSNVYANALSSQDLTEALNLNSSIFNISYSKNGASNDMYLYKNEGLRMYATKQTTNGNKFTVTISSDYTITSILIHFRDNSSATAEISSGSSLIEGNDGVYSINNNEFTVFNNNSSVNSNTQVKIQDIAIFYRVSTAAEKVKYSLTQTNLSFHYVKNGNEQFEYSNISIRFGGLISKALWNELDTNEHVISGFGVMITAQNSYSIKNHANDAVLAESSPDINTQLVNYFMPKASMATPVEQGDNYFWNLFQQIDYADVNKTFTAVAYVKVGENYIFMKQVEYSVKTLAADYIANRGCNAETADGSLSSLAN